MVLSEQPEVDEPHSKVEEPTFVDILAAKRVLESYLQPTPFFESICYNLVKNLAAARSEKPPLPSLSVLK